MDSTAHNYKNELKREVKRMHKKQQKKAWWAAPLKINHLSLTFKERLCSKCAKKNRRNCALPLCIFFGELHLLPSFLAMASAPSFAGIKRKDTDIDRSKKKQRKGSDDYEASVVLPKFVHVKQNVYTFKITKPSFSPVHFALVCVFLGLFVFLVVVVVLMRSERCAGDLWHLCMWGVRHGWRMRHF